MSRGERFKKRDDRIVARVLSGVPAKDVARKLKLPYTVVCRVSRERGVTLREVPLKPPADSGDEATDRARRIHAKAHETYALGRPLPDRVMGAETYTDEEDEFFRRCEAYRVRYKFNTLRATDYLFVLKGMGYGRPEK